MNNNLEQIKTAVLDKCFLSISNFEFESESTVYDACRFELNGLKIISRNAKITPKKSGQFVTFWKRTENNPIEPFEETDPIDFYLVTIRTETDLGFFVFPKSLLIKKGIISTKNKEGKRAFRVYPPWTEANNAQAIRTQKWQQAYFIPISDSIDIVRVKRLFDTK